MPRILKQLINRSSRDDSGNPASPEYLLRWLLQMSPHFVPLGADMWSAAHNTSGRRQQKKEFKFTPSSGIRSLDPRDICEILSTSMSPQKTASVIANAANRSYTLVAFVERYSGESVIHLFFLDKLRAYWEYTFLRNATSLIEAGYQCNNNTGPSFWEIIDTCSARSMAFEDISHYTTRLNSQLSILNDSQPPGARSNVAVVTTSGVDPFSSWTSHEIESHRKHLTLQARTGVLPRAWLISGQRAMNDFAYVNGSRHDAPVKSCTRFA